MPLKTLHNTFTKGELDPTLNSRVDIDIYTKGARKLRNMMALWTGAARIAPGSIDVDLLVDRENSDAPITNADFINGVDFLYDAEGDKIYTIIVRASSTSSYPTAIDIYIDDALDTTITGTASIPLDYAQADIAGINFVTGQDRVLFLHEDYAPGQLIFDGTTWTFNTLNFSVPPTFDYSTIGLINDYRVSGFTFGLSAGTVGTGRTLTASSAVFDDSHVGGYFIYPAEGAIAEITAVASTTSATVTIASAFTTTSGLRGLDSVLYSRMYGDYTGGSTPAPYSWGYPSRGAFYLNRLILGRSPRLKNIVAVSQAGIFNNFYYFDLPELNAWTASFGGKGEQAVESVVSDDSIVFVTTGKTFAQSPLFETPIQSDNFYFAPQCSSPSSQTEAVTIDNQILHVSANRSQVNQLLYSTSDAKYMSYPTGLLSNQLFDLVNSNATWEPQSIEARLYLATQDNGSMLMYNTLQQQGVSAWSLRTTRGKYKRVIGESRQASAIVERQVNLGASTFETAFDYVYLSGTEMKSFYDVQAEFEDNSSAIAVFENELEYIVLGNDIPVTAIDWNLNTVASASIDPTFEYLDGNGNWNSFTPTDNTAGLTSSDTMTWAFSDVSNWAPNKLNDIEDKYWLRIRRNALDAAVATTPIVLQVQVNTGVRLYLERFDFDEYTDLTSTVTSSGTGVVTGQTNLAGHQVYAIKNGATSGPYFVDDSGEVTIDEESSTVKLGIQYKPKLVPMPLFTPTSDGDNTYSQKYVQDMFVDYVDSLYLQAGAEPLLTDIPNMNLGNYTLGQPVPPQTGVYRIQPMGEWGARQEVTITQSQPGPMEIIGIGYHVELT